MRTVITTAITAKTAAKTIATKSECDVVVEEKEERCSLDHAEGFVAGGGVPRPIGQETDEGLGEKAADTH